MTGYELTDVSLNDVSWDDFRCLVHLRVTFRREPWYPFGNRCDIEGGSLEISDFQVMGAVLLDWQSTTYPASPEQCRAIERQIRAESREKVRVALEGVMAE